MSNRLRGLRADRRCALRGARALAFTAGLALLFALPANAAELVKVRAGAHPDFTRVVFELDHAAGYRIERTGTPSRPVLRVTIEASSGEHRIGAHGDVRGVKVSPGAQGVAEIPLRRGDLRLQEMMLANPPRIVLDLKRPEPVATAAPAPKAKPAPVAKKPAPKPAPVAKKPEPAPKPAPVAVKPEAKPAPKPVAKPTARPQSPVAKRPQAKPGPAEMPTVAKPPPAPSDSQAAKREALARPEARMPIVPPPAEGMERADTPFGNIERRDDGAAEDASKQPAGAPNAADSPDDFHPAKADPAPVAKPHRAEGPTGKAPAKRAGNAESEPASATYSPLLLGSIVGGIVALVGIAFTLRRRNRALPSDLDADAISQQLDDDDAAESSAEAGSLFAADASEEPSESEQSEERPAETPSDLPADASIFSDAASDLPSDPTVAAASGFDANELPIEPASDANDLPIEPAPSEAPPSESFGDSPFAPEPSVPAAEGPSDLPSDPGVFAAEPEPAREAITGPEFDVEASDAPSPVAAATTADASQGEAQMNQDMDLPADPSLAPPPPVAAASMGGASSPDVAAMLEAFEQRMQGLEAKLAAANEAREKLERQVAAQSEELRVQRAAIARTQRALRTMSRGDEEKATEPALRDGDTKTRLTP